MHLYLYFRGTPERVELAKSIINGQFWQWKRINNTTNKEELSILQGVLRPSILGMYELIIPEPCLPDVLAFLSVADNLLQISVGRFKTKFKLGIFRKFVGCKAIPKKILKQAINTRTDFTINGTNRALCSLRNLNLCSIHVVGIKKDRVGEMGNYTQELL